MGNTLNKIGKFPVAIGENEKVEDKVKEIKSTVRFQLKKVLCMGTAVGVATMTEEEIHPTMLMGGMPGYSLGTRSELAMADYIVEICKRRYLSYPDDKDRLNDNTISQREKLAIKLKQGERNILNRIGSYYHQETVKLAEKLRLEEEEFIRGERGAHSEL